MNPKPPKTLQNPLSSLNPPNPLNPQAASPERNPEEFVSERDDLPCTTSSQPFWVQSLGDRFRV